MATQNTIPDFDTLVRKLLEDAVIFAEVTGINFFKGSFENQGWTDGSFTAWQQRKTGADGRSILVQSHNLLNSLRVLESSPLRIVFGTSEPYAAIHNNGGTIQIRVTQKAKKFFWYMFKATRQNYWKWMALTKKEHLTIHMPQRKFIGESQTLMQQLDTWIINEIKKRFKQL